LAKRYYDGDDESVLPRNIATKAAFRNAVALDVAMGGSTNTVLHLLAAAREADLDFSIAEIDAISRQVPCLSKVAPNSQLFHMEDVHRAGGIPALLGELDRAGLLERSVHAVHSPSLTEWLGEWDIRGGSASEAAYELFHAAPGGVRTTEPFSTTNRWVSLDTDAAEGCIRDREHAYTADGGLAVLHGNIAPDGCVVKTAGVPEEVWHFEGTARVYESQDDAVSGILAKEVVAGDVVVIRYEGPKGRPGMQERAATSPSCARATPSPSTRISCGWNSTSPRPSWPNAAKAGKPPHPATRAACRPSSRSTPPAPAKARCWTTIRRPEAARLIQK